MSAPVLRLCQASGDGDYYIVHRERSYRDVVICSHVQPDWRFRLAACAYLVEVAELVADAADAPMASGKRDGFTRPTEKEWREIVTKARAAIARARGGE